MTFAEIKYITKRVHRPGFLYLVMLNIFLSLIDTVRVKKYRVVSEKELFARKKSETIFIFGSGYSINLISEEEREKIQEHNTMGFNWFFKGDIVRIDYHLIREIAHVDFGRDQWFPQIKEYADGINGNPRYRDTILLIQKGLTATNGNRFLFYRLLEGKRNHRYKPAYRHL